MRFIRRAQALGFTLEETASLLSLDPARACAPTRTLAAHKLAQLEGKMADLTALHAALLPCTRRWANWSTGAIPVAREPAVRFWKPWHTTEYTGEYAGIETGQPRWPRIRSGCAMHPYEPELGSMPVTLTIKQVPERLAEGLRRRAAGSIAGLSNRN